MKKIYMLILLCGSIFYNLKSQSIDLVVNSMEGSQSTELGGIISNGNFLMYGGNVRFTEYYRKWGANFVLRTLNERECYVTDGTSENTRVIDMNTNTEERVDAKNETYTYYFSGGFGFPFIHNEEIYFQSTDATGEGVFKMTDINATPQLVTRDLSIGESVQLLNDMYITREGGGAQPFLQWDATSAAPSELPNQRDENDKLIHSVSNGKWIVWGDKILMNAYLAALNGWDGQLEGHLGNELYLYDPESGLEAQLLKNHRAEGTYNDGSWKAYSGDPYSFVLNDDGSIVYYAAINEDGITTLWQTDGTTDGTVEVTEVNEALGLTADTKGSSDFFADKGIFLHDGYLYFEADDATHRDQLYKFSIANKTLSRLTTLVNDSEAAIDLNPANFTEFGGIIYFTGANKAGSTVLYSYDGSSVQTIDESITNVGNLTVFNNKIYMSAEDVDGFDENGDGSSMVTTGIELFVYAPSDNPTGISKASELNNLEIYPNPSSGHLNIKGLENEQGSYELFDLTGRRLERGLVNNGQINYNLGKGIYVLRVQDGNRTQITKITVN